MIAVVVGSFLSILLGRFWQCGVGAILLALLFRAFTVQPLGWEVGGFNIYLEDVVFVAVLAASAFRLSFAAKLAARHFPWILFGLAIAIAFSVGISAYGIKPAVVECRLMFYYFSAGLYCASFRTVANGLKVLVGMWLVVAVVLVALAWYRWAAEFLFLGLPNPWAGIGGYNRYRVLNAEQALYLLEALVMLWYLGRRTSRRLAYVVFAIALVFTIALLQHRTVWIATLAAALLVLWRDRVLTRKTTAIAALVLSLGILPIYLYMSSGEGEAAESLRSSASEPFSSDSTFGWRMEMWQGYLREFSAGGAKGMVFGTGIGNTTVYVAGNQGVSAQAHNHFVEILNRVGLLGLVTLVWAYWVMISRLKHTGGAWNPAAFLLPVAVAQIVFCLSYSPVYDQGIIVGLIFGLSDYRGRPPGTTVKVTNVAEQERSSLWARSPMAPCQLP